MKTAADIIKELGLGEDSSRQFKEQLNTAVQIAAELCAMSNSRGGVIYVGVKDDGTVAGISAGELHTYNQYISSAASDLVRPAVYPQTTVTEIDGKTILCIDVPDGPSKPYCDNNGAYWIKVGSDKRKASPQELLRLFQQSAQLNLDETVTSAPVSSIDRAKFYTFFEQQHGQEVAATGLPLDQVLNNMNLAREEHLTLAGLLLFGQNVQATRPFCLIRAVSYPGTAISDDQFNDKRDCLGTLDEQFRSAMAFLKNNLSRIQKEDSFNTTGVLEVDEKALEEALVNALLHRDYSKNAVIRLFVFADRVELVSPGSLPNHLSIENIRNGNSVMRNPLLASFGTKLLPYSGIGSGVPRMVKRHPATTLINDREGEQFTVVMQRP